MNIVANIANTKVIAVSDDMNLDFAFLVGSFSQDVSAVSTSLSLFSSISSIFSNSSTVCKIMGEEGSSSCSSFAGALRTGSAFSALSGVGKNASVERSARFTVAR